MGAAGGRLQRQPAPPFRDRNSWLYRLAHWPIWIFVFGIVPGPLTFNLFERGLDAAMAWWLAVVLLFTGMAGLRGRLPGVEPKPYILRFTEDKPNPLYRRVCYTAAWGDLLVFAMLNLTGLAQAAITGVWHLRQIYEYAYVPLALVVWTCGALGGLPRVRASTKGEGTERRYFYGAVWAVVAAESVLGLLWKALPRTREADAIKLLIFAGLLTVMGCLSAAGKLPRTQPIEPDQWTIAD